jgi:hypothetical protein
MVAIESRPQFGNGAVAGRHGLWGPDAMNTEKRTTLRRPARYTAWVSAGEGAPLHGCIVSDVSLNGAKLELEAPKALPDSFYLVFTNRGKPRRRCRVVWRAPGAIGIAFETPILV